MTLYAITGEYPTAGPDAFEWGEPEEHVEELLEEFEIDGVKIGAGTSFSGDCVRDVQFEVRLDDVGAQYDLVWILSHLPERERLIWTVEENPAEELL